MSLINDALNRARAEAARRAASRRPQPSLPPVEIPVVQRRTPWLAIALIVPAVAALTALATLRLAGGRTVESSVTTTPALPPVEPTVSLPAEDAPIPAAADANEETVEPVPERNLDQAAVADEPGGASEEPPVAVAQEVAALPARAAPEVQSPANPAIEPPAESATHVQRVALPDGLILELGGIAWSETQPLALLNGSVLGVGDSVEGFRLLEVQRSQVTLEQAGETIVLRLR